jgi:REP element-mobilizing transposase RayT
MDVPSRRDLRGALFGREIARSWSDAAPRPPEASCGSSGHFRAAKPTFNAAACDGEKNYANLLVVKKPRQLGLPFPKRGGRQPGSGRPRTREYPGVIGNLVPHLRRKSFSSARAVHVTQRLRPGVGYLRKQGPAKVVQRAFVDAADRGGMRIAHYSIQGSHLHLVVEADDHVALSHGMQGLSVRVARRLNRHLGRRGQVFADRFHANVLESRRQVANAVRYVIGNYRRHTREYLQPDFRDEYATRADRPLAEPKLWLLRVGWRAERLRKPSPFEPP